MVGVKNPVYGDITVGRVLTWTKQYTEDEVRHFYSLVGSSGDYVPEYLPYVLVVAPLTKLGGDLNYLSSRMDLIASRPVRRDETMTAELEVTRLRPAYGMTMIAFDVRLRCGDEIVLHGRTKGVVVAD